MDALVKNCGPKIHVLIGQYRFMTTLSKISRVWLRGYHSRSKTVANHGLDTIQAWGEAFETRKFLYPHIYGTYMKLRAKDYIKFPKVQYDPRRVPIFLGPITTKEKQYVAEYQYDVSEDLDAVVRCFLSTNDEEKLSEATSPSIHPTCPSFEQDISRDVEYFEWREGTIDSSDILERDLGHRFDVFTLHPISTPSKAYPLVGEELESSIKRSKESEVVCAAIQTDLFSSPNSDIFAFGSTECLKKNSESLDEERNGDDLMKLDPLHDPEFMMEYDSFFRNHSRMIHEYEHRTNFVGSETPLNSNMPEMMGRVEEDEIKEGDMTHSIVRPLTPEREKKRQSQIDHPRFHCPSSDSKNQIRYYGTQRVIKREIS